MAKKRVTDTIYNQIVDMRKRGYGVNEIVRSVGFSKNTVSKYLKDVEVEVEEGSAATKEWEQAEKEAADILQKNGFSHILDLNQVGANPYWDYYAEKGGKDG